MKGKITTFETMGSADGPGVRLVLFLCGCKLRCKYCHNPESWCGKGEVKYISPEEVLNLYNRYKVYYGEGGGVTFSGGEPLLQSDFVLETAKLLKDNGVHVALDTAGVGQINEDLLKIVDLVILDIKSVDEKEYEDLTGHSMLEFLEFLKVCQRFEKKLWLRQVIVPTINDDKKHIFALKEFIKPLKNIERVELLPYHSMAKSKYKELGLEYKLENIENMNSANLKELQDLL